MNLCCRVACLDLNLSSGLAEARGMTAERCAKAAAGAGLNGGPVRPYLPGGIQKGRLSCFSSEDLCCRAWFDIMMCLT